MTAVFCYSAARYRQLYISKQTTKSWGAALTSPDFIKLAITIAEAFRAAKS